MKVGVEGIPHASWIIAYLAFDAGHGPLFVAPNLSCASVSESGSIYEANCLQDTRHKPREAGTE